MRKIKLTNCEKYVLVDDEDYKHLNAFKWRFESGNFKNGKGYAARRTQKDYKITYYFMHRVILDVPKDKVVDHINNNPLDNRKKNLRITTKHYNALNRAKRSDCKTPYKGVTFENSKTNPFGATICYKGKQQRLGMFKTALAARKAYLKAARKLHGEFAN